MKVFFVILIFTGLLSACSKAFLIESPVTYKGGDEISGEQLNLTPMGTFNYERWEDFTEQKVSGNYKLKAGKIVLTTNVYGDSLKVEERIVHGDSLWIKVELWDSNFEKPIAPFTHLRLQLLRGEEILEDLQVESGEVRIPKIAFRSLQLLSSGLLVKLNYQVQHPRANYFHCKFRLGNDAKALSHLHFWNSRWPIKEDKIVSQIWLQGKKRTRTLNREIFEN